MSKKLLFALLFASLPSCTLLFNAPETAEIPDAAIELDAGMDLDTLYDFSESLAPWSKQNSCSLAMDPTDLANQIVCCEAGANPDSVISLPFAETRAVRVSFRLLLQSTPTGSTPEHFSPLAGFNDDADLGDVVLANLNTFSELSFAVASVPGAGTVPNSNQTGSYAVDEWLQVRLTARTLADCPGVGAEISAEGLAAQSVILPFTRNISDKFSHVLLGVFRQHPSAGTNRRCFDDVIVSELDGCD